MSRYIFQSPSRYIQGKGVINSLADEVDKLGDAPLIISDSFVWSLTNKDINESFKSSEISYKYEEFNGEASENEIARLSQIAKNNNINVIVGVGGGKTLDTQKQFLMILILLLLLSQQLLLQMPLRVLYQLFIQMKVFLLVIDFTIKTQM